MAFMLGRKKEALMLAIVLTHAEAQSVQKPCFRTLSDQGRIQVDAVAAQFRAIAATLAPELLSKRFAIAEIISSPMARCVETALRFSDAIKDITATSDVRVRDRLKERRAGQLSAGDLVSVLDETISQAVLICTHGDLAGALPANATLDSKYNNGGWFTIRPVLVVIEYERGSKWDDKKVLYCGSPANNWESLFTKQQLT
jgi:phosphohistidine phosphatase SixA